MKRHCANFLFFLVLGFSGGNLHAQLGWNWVNGIDGTNFEIANGIAVDTANGAVYIVGDWRNSSMLPAPWGFPTGSGDIDFFVAKYDTNGNFIWAFPVGSSGDDHAMDVAVGSSGEIYVTGSYTGTTDFNGVGGGPLPISGSANPQFFLARYAPTGNLQWVTGSTGTGTIDHIGTALATDALGVYVTGGYEGKMTLESVAPFPATRTGFFSNSNQNLFVARYSIAGAVTWFADAGGGGVDIGRDIYVDNTRAYIIGDYSSSPLSLYDGLRPGTPNATPGNAGGTDILLLS